MKKILILATDEAINVVLKEKLIRYQLNVRSLHYPGRLADTINSFKPDLLIIDFFLEDINGGSICHQLKCNASTHQLPVILLTEYPELISFSRKFGCNAAIAKPVDVQALRTKISMLTAPGNETRVGTINSRGLNHKKRIFQH